MLRPSVLALAVVLSSPALWAAFISESMGVTTALIRFLIAVPVAALMLGLLRSVTASYHRAVLERNAHRAMEAARLRAAGERVEH